MALDSLVLRLKSLRIKNIFDFPYIETPDKQGMITSIDLLKLLGCLDDK
jgi:HrpA-like RNA helicase